MGHAAPVLQMPRWHADQWPESRGRVIEGSLRRGHEPQRPPEKLGYRPDDSFNPDLPTFVWMTNFGADATPRRVMHPPVVLLACVVLGAACGSSSLTHQTLPDGALADGARPDAAAADATRLDATPVDAGRGRAVDV